MEITYQLTAEDREAVIERLLEADPMVRGSVARIRRARRNARLFLAAAAILMLFLAFQLRPDRLLSDPMRAVAFTALLAVGFFVGIRAVTGGKESPEDQCREALDKANWMQLRGTTDTVSCDGSEFRVSGEAGYEVSRPGGIERVDVSERFILVYKPNMTMVTIPKRAFASSEEADAFAALVQQMAERDRT